MEIPVKVEAFEGPMDLLLHLIEKNKINIYDIPISTITDQYIEVINSMEIPDLDSESAFLVMASTLVNIKSRMLLPKEKDEETGEEIDPRAELVERLLEYKMFKYSAKLLKRNEKDAAHAVFREPQIPAEVAKYKEEPDIEAMTAGLTLAKLHQIYNFVIKKQNGKIDPVRSSFGKIQREPVSLVQCLPTLTSYAKERGEFSFSEFLMEQPDKLHVIVNFLALLELIKLGSLQVVQNGASDDITVHFVAELKLSAEELEQMGDM